MQAFLAQQSARFGFAFGVQEIAEVETRLDAGADPVAIAQLTEAEAALAAGLRIRKRQVEWLAGRMAAKAAFRMRNSNQVNQVDLRPPFLEPISVLRRSSGAPYLAEHPALHVSISHSHAYAVAVVAGFAIGLDIEKSEPRPEALLVRFFCPEERQLIEQTGRQLGQRDTLITQLWSRKEAVAKYLGLGGRLDFQQINTASDQVKTPSGALRLVSGVCDGYCMSLALPGAV